MKNILEPILYNFKKEFSTKEQTIEKLSLIINSLITKSYEEGKEEGENTINKRAEKYITEVMGYTCPDFRI